MTRIWPTRNCHTLRLRLLALRTMPPQAKNSITGEINGQLSEMREIFSIFDPNGDGAITADEIAPVLQVTQKAACIA